MPHVNWFTSRLVKIKLIIAKVVVPKISFKTRLP